MFRVDRIIELELLEETFEFPLISTSTPFLPQNLTLSRKSLRVFASTGNLPVYVREDVSYWALSRNNRMVLSWQHSP